MHPDRPRHRPSVAPFGEPAPDPKGARWPADTRGRRFPPEVLTPAEVRRLIAARTGDTWWAIRDRALITLIYRTGLRCSEALALFPKDVDRDAGSIQVLHGKGDRRRIVGIDGGGIEVLQEWDELRTGKGFARTDPLFCTTSGRRLTGPYVRTLLPKLAAKAGIEKRTHPHGLRHAHAMELLNEGVPVAIIQRQLGHTSLATTDKYLSHLTPVDVIKAIRKRNWEL